MRNDLQRQPSLMHREPNADQLDTNSTHDLSQNLILYLLLNVAHESIKVLKRENACLRQRVIEFEEQEKSRKRAPSADDLDVPSLAAGAKRDELLDQKELLGRLMSLAWPGA